jgi:DNA-binding beta-propeller fold protein YncE
MAVRQFSATTVVRSIPHAAWALALVAGAAVCCALLPPQVAFRPQPVAGLTLVAVGAIAVLWPGRQPWNAYVRWSGAAVLWGVVGWCALSQVAPLTQPRSLVWSLRGLPIVAAAGLWLWPQLSPRWLRRALVAVALPTGAALALVAWCSPPRPLDFQPYYVAVDAQGTVYVTDAESPVIRVFGPDGTLRAKLRPGLASRQGPPGPGFSPPGPYSDPEGLGVPRATPGTARVSGALQPWPTGTDDFWFCGLALDGHNRLHVPDWMRGSMLRFAPDGRLQARWPLPRDYRPSLGCVATAGADVYLSDSRGTILRLDASGHTLDGWALSERIVGGITVTPDGTALYALAQERVYRLDLRRRDWTSWPLPAPRGPLGQPYQAILAPAADRVLVANLAAHRVDGHRADGAPDGYLGGPGPWPGQFGQVGGLAHAPDGHLYVADFDHRALQRLDASGRPDALFRSPDDDEAE